MGIKASKLPQLKIICPPIQEQRAILNHLKTALDNFKREGAVGTQKIELLEEYRTRLIADVVTGKLDVREATAAMPEELDAPTDTMKTIKVENAAEMQEKVLL